ncbi:hypothetical protein ACUUL3_01485 [Thiovibrio sp. JS02]
MCKRIKGERGWNKSTAGKNVRASHGYCPECFQQTMERVQNFFVVGPGQGGGLLTVR